MAKKTDPPKKKTSSPVGPYKAAPKGDKSTGVRKMTAPKAKGGSQFLPKGIPAGSKKNTPPATRGLRDLYFHDNTGKVKKLYGTDKNNYIESLDTTGYGKGKKSFDLQKNYSDGGMYKGTVKREDVPAKIKQLQKGATNMPKTSSSKKK